MGKYVDERKVINSLTRSIGNGWRVGRRVRVTSPGYDWEEEVTLLHPPSGYTIYVDSQVDGGVRWVHASIAGTHAHPTYEDVKALHRAIYGDGYAYQVFAPPEDHVNFHERCYHLWGRLDGEDILPFGR